MPKKGEKVVSEERLEALAKARQKALEVRRANKEIKDKEKELAKLEKDEKRADLDSRIKQKKTVKDMAGNEVPIENTQSQKQRDHAESYDKDLEPLETKSQPIDIPKKERKAKKKVKYVYESDSSSSEEEVVVVRKKKAGKVKKHTDNNSEVDKDEEDTGRPHTSNENRPLSQAELQRQQYLARVSQMPQYRTNLFGGF